MVDGNLKNSDTEIKFANWNDGYIDLFNELKNIRALGNQALFDIGNQEGVLSLYFARISGLYDTHWFHITETDGINIERKLRDIQEILFSEEYLERKKRKNFDREQHQKIMDALKKYFRIMCHNFSRQGLTMKVLQIKKKASENENLTDEEREELEALEEVGII